MSLINQKVLGYINDDSNEVGKVHFGILYLVETDSTEVRPRDPEIHEGRLMSIDELEAILSSEDVVENWSQIAIASLRDYLKQI